MTRALATTPAAPTPVGRSLMVDQVFDVLRREIARGDLAPGEQLRIQAATRRGEVAESVGEDEHLLGALYAAGRNDVLTGIVRGLWDTCRPYKNLWVLHAADQGVDAWRHVPPLIDATERNDSAGVRDILRATYQQARDLVRELIEKKGTDR